LKEKVEALGIRHADYTTPLSIPKVGINFAEKSGSRSVGIVRSRTKAMEFVCLHKNKRQQSDYSLFLIFKIKREIKTNRSEWVTFEYHAKIVTTASLLQFVFPEL
jgi:hypothetical protein